MITDKISNHLLVDSDNIFLARTAARASTSLYFVVVLSQIGIILTRHFHYFWILKELTLTLRNASWWLSNGSFVTSKRLHTHPLKTQLPKSHLDNLALDMLDLSLQINLEQLFLSFSYEFFCYCSSALRFPVLSES